MIPIYEADRLDPAALLSRDIQAEEDVSAAVDAILRDVRARETRRCGPIRSSSTACPWTGSR